jgi:hypothetical protein
MQTHLKTSDRIWDAAVEPAPGATQRRAWADTIVAKHQSVAPVNVAAVARELGVSVFAADLGQGVSGVLKRDSQSGSSGYTIYVQKSHPLPRQRFTVAHELGHFVLHSSYFNPDVGIKDDEFYRALPGPLETQANQYAADLLMPWKLINQLQNAGSTDLPSLANKLAVSRQALAIRLGLPYDQTWE